MIIPVLKIKQNKLDKVSDCDFLIKLNKNYFIPLYALGFMNDYSISDTDLYHSYLNYRKYLKNRIQKYVDSVSFSDIGLKVEGLKPSTVKLLMALQKYFLGVLNRESSKFLDKYLPVKEFDDYIVEYLTDFTTFFMANTNRIKVLSNNELSLYITEKALLNTSIMKTYLVDTDKAWPIPVIVSSDIDKIYIYSLSGSLLFVITRNVSVKNLSDYVKYIKPAELVRIQDSIIENNVRMYSGLSDKYLYASGFVVYPEKRIGVLFSTTSDESMVSPGFSNSVSFIGFKHDFYITVFDNNMISKFQPDENGHVLMHVRNSVKPIVLSVYEKEYDKFLVFVRRVYGNKVSD